MVEIKVQASDSATAMEEVEKRLGSDALIVSTTKVDGKIEIVATNDEPSKYKKTPEPLILDGDYRVTNFSDALADKIEKTRKEELKTSDRLEPGPLDESIHVIKEELQKLEKLSLGGSHPRKMAEANSVATLLQVSGISKNVVELLSKNAPEKSLEHMAKTLSKMFVNGKCPHFESSDVILITGPVSSGKSVFSKKLITYLKNKEEIKDCTNLNPDNPRGLVKKINSWASNTDYEKNKTKQIAVAELGHAEDVDRILIDINKNNPKLKISIINACAVGNSYQYLKGNFSERSAENEYLAITKLDLCDLSLSEISAFIELNHKCLFFSGIETGTEGLFFAHVDKVKSHILQNIENREF